MSKQYQHYGIEDFFCQDLSDSLLTENQVKLDHSTYDSSKGKKLYKNRISAQNSRMKKKMYIDSLERNQRELISQIQQTERQIEQTNQHLNSILTKNKQNDSFNHDQKPTYQRLKSLVRSELFDEDEAAMLIELLINRVGVTGKERRRMTDYYSKRLVNFSIPAIYRYMLHASTAGQGLLATDSRPMYSWDGELYERVVLSEGQKKDLLRTRDRVSQQKQSWIEKIQAFEQVRSQIYTISYQVEQNMLVMKGMLNLRQMGEIIIRIQNRKYNKDLALGEKQLTNHLEKTSSKYKAIEEGFQKETSRKKVKLEQP